MTTIAAKRQLKMVNTVKKTKQRVDDETAESSGKNDNIQSSKDYFEFCGLPYYSNESVKKGDWIKCQKCHTWYHEICVGAKGKKQFKCGNCL